MSHLVEAPTPEPIILELGCGDRKRIPQAIGIDVRDLPSVDIVGNVFSVLAEFPTASVQGVYSFHFLEHIDNLDALLQECARVLMAGGSFVATVPHFSSPYFYSDPTHRRGFGLYTMNYLVREPWPTKRSVPQYTHPLPFKVDDIRLTFKSPRPFYFRYVLKRLLSKILTWGRPSLEFYEENLCWVFPAYEITYRMTRIAEETEGDS